RDDLLTLASGVFDEALANGVGDSPTSLMRYIFDNLSYQLPAGFDGVDLHDKQTVKSCLTGLFAASLDDKQETLKEADAFTKFQNICFLKCIDVAWVEQVDFLEQLKTVVAGRNMAQHKVEYEYRREAFFAFEEMKRRINRDIVRLLSLSRIEVDGNGGLVLQFA
ncbi:MAG: hypothetical protein LBB54_03000, partial [Cellulomonadaceae bacterium]|nr:hypothetical protein [Cellulomonadaceae bacterium]